MDTYKHYIRAENNIVVEGYADWESEKRNPDEIQLAGEYNRQFLIGLVSPPPRSHFIYKLVNGQMTVRSQVELDTEYAARPIPPDPDVELTAAITNATTLDELKKALLGTNGKLAKVVGKMK